MKKKINNLLVILLFISTIFSTILSLYLVKKENTLVVSNIVESKEKIAYLTFDDGPSNNTEQILNILDKYNVKATFFILGPEYTMKNEMLKKIVQAGHEIAIHSYEHNYDYIYSSKENYLKDFYKCYNWVKKITGKEPKLYRFPGGSSNTIASKSLIKSIIKELDEKGFTHADWNVDTLDSYVKSNYSQIITNATKAIKMNENNNHYYQTILMHDDIKKPSSIKALPSLIEKLIDKGYHFETLTTSSHIIKHVK